MKHLISSIALLAALPHAALAGDLAIDVVGTVISTDATVPAPFSSAQVGDAVQVHYSLFHPGDFSVPGQSTYELDHAATRIQIGSVFSPVSATPVFPGTPPVTLIDGATDTLIADVLMPGAGEWFRTAVQDPTGALIADVDILNMQGHTAGPFSTSEGSCILVSQGLVEIWIQIDMISFGPEGDYAYGSYCTFFASPCPCGNAGGPGEGCANSTGKGARLAVFGAPSVSTDTLEFVSIQHPPGVPGLLFTGTDWTNGGAGLPIADGLLCVGGMTQRLDVVFSDAVGTASWGPGLLTQINASAGETRYFQSWYRNVSGSPCGGGFNFSQGISTIVFL